MAPCLLVTISSPSPRGGAQKSTINNQGKPITPAAAAAAAAAAAGSTNTTANESPVGVLVIGSCRRPVMLYIQRKYFKYLCPDILLKVFSLYL